MSAQPENEPQEELPTQELSELHSTHPLPPHLATSSATVPLVSVAPPPPLAVSSATVPLAMPQFSAPGGDSVTMPLSTQPLPTQPLSARSARFGRRGLGIAVLVLAVLAGGGFAAYHFLGGTSLPGPEAAVTAYFQDLASGDAKDAAALATGPYRGTPVVGAETLADPAERPNALAIVSSEQAGAGEVQVSVTYTVHGTVHDDIFIAAQEAGTSAWKLVDPYRLVEISGGWSSKVTVDGESVDESDDLELFPGAHVIADPTSRDFAAESVTVYPTTDGAANAAQATFGAVTLPDPKLSTAGQSAAQNAYRDALTACAVQAATGTGVCGLDNTYNGYTCNTVTWTITNVGAVQVDLASANGDGTFDVSASGSTASESGDYSDWLGIDRTFQNQSADLEDSNGSLAFNSDGSATLTLDN